MAAAPIPRLFAPVTITAGVNDLLLFRAETNTGSLAYYSGAVAAGQYLTPELLAAAVQTAGGAAIRSAGNSFTSTDAGYFGCYIVPDGSTRIVLANIDETTAVASVVCSTDVLLPAWVATTAYTAESSVVKNGGKVYHCTVSGTSAGSGGPTHASGTAADGTATWLYLGTTTALDALLDLLGFEVQVSIAGEIADGSFAEWAAGTTYAVGDIVKVAATSRAYRCMIGGLSGGTAPSGTGTGIADGVVRWDYVAPTNGSLFTSDQMPSLWTPGLPVRSDTKRDLYSHVVVAETAGGQNVSTRWTPTSPVGGRYEERRLRFEFLPPHKVWQDEEGIAYINESFERFWLSSAISRFRYSPDRADPTTGAQDYYFKARTASEALRDVQRVSDSVELFALDLEMGEYNA